MSQADDYSVKIDANVSPYQQNMAAATQSTNSFTSALAAAGQQIDSVLKKADRRLTFITAANVATLTAAGVAAAQLNQQMSQLDARLVMNNRNTQSYTSTVSSLRREIGLTSTEAITLVTNLNRMQVPFNAQKATATEYMKLQAVTGESANGLAASQQQLMRTMGSNQTQIQRYSSMVATLNQQYGAGAQSTLDFANSIAPLSKTMGMTTQQITGISAAFSKAGADGGAAANVYTKVLSDINRAVQYGSPELKVYSDLIGVSVDTFKQMPKADVVTSIFNELNRQGPQSIKTLERLGLEGVRSQRAIQSVVAQGGLQGGINAAGKGWEDTGPFNKASREAMDGFVDSMNKAGQSLSTFAQGVGSTFLPVMEKLGDVTTTTLKPLGVFGDWMSNLPTWAKNVGAMALALGALVPLIPKIAAGLGATSLLSVATRGAFGQGVRLARNPSRISGPQQTYIEGGGNFLYRRLFGAGMGIGDMFNRGQRGRLDDIDFRTARDADGRTEGRRVRSNYASMVDRMMGAGLVPSNFREEGFRVPQRAGRAGAAGIRGLSGLISEQLRPWDPEYLMDSARQSERSKTAFVNTPRLRDTPALSRARFMFSHEGIRSAFQDREDAKQGIRDARSRGSRGGMTDEQANWAAVNKSMKAADTEVQGFTKGLRKTNSVFGEIVRQGASLTGATARASVGVAGAATVGGARLAGRGAAALGGALMSTAGGPIGLGIAGVAGLGVLGANVYSDRQDFRRKMADSEGSDMSAGSTYRNALGEASRQTMTFASIMEESTRKMTKVASNMDEALTITDAQGKKFSGRTDLIQDNTVKTGSRDQVQRYASAMLRDSSPAAAEQLKNDVTARFGAVEGQRLLDAAYSERNNIGNQFGMVTQGQGIQMFGKERFKGSNLGQLFTAQSTQDASVMLRDTMASQLAAANSRSPEEGARVQQAMAAGYGQSVLKGQGNQAELRAGSREDIGRREALLGQMGITEDDEASRKGFAKLISDYQNRGTNMTASQRQNLFDEMLYKGDYLSNTTLGAQLSRARGMGGAVSNSDYSIKGNRDLGDLAGFGSQRNIDNIRMLGGSAGMVATNTSTQGGYYAAQALRNEGNADYQMMGQRALAQDVIGRNGGDLERANAELAKLANNAGPLSDKFRQLVDATTALVQAERQHADVMGGRTDLTDRMATGRRQYGEALQKFRDAPEVEGNYAALEEARKNNQALEEEAKAWVQQYADQIRAVYFQRGQQEDAFNRQRKRATDEFYIQQRYQEEDFAIQKARNLRNFRIQEQRSTEDFNRQRRREEEDWQTQQRRMAVDQAKSLYSIYQRITVQRTWGSGNLLSNMQDQQEKLAAQNQNLDKVRKMGLSDAAINQLGLGDAQNAQQLERMVGDLQTDPGQVAKFNKLAKNRIAESGKLMRDESNEQWKRTVEDREKNLDRGSEDFDRSLQRARKDLNRSMKDSEGDMSRSQERQKEQLNRSMTNMRSDMDYQFGQQLDSINFFAEETGKSWEEAFKVTDKNVTGGTKLMLGKMSKLMSDLNDQTSKSVEDLEKEVGKPYEAWGLKPGTKSSRGNSNTTYTTPSGRKAQAGGADSDSSGSTPSISSSGGGSSWGWPTHSHSTQGGAVYGQKGGWRGSSSLGPGFHSGTDFPNPTGTPIYAAQDGTVIYKGGGGAYGNFTKVAHGNGLQTWYAHQSGFNVSQGDRVRKGEQIGRVGATGNTTGPHLHFEVRVNGADKDPMKYLKGMASTPSGGMMPDTPDFKNMKSVKAFEKLIGSMDYFDKKYTPFHALTLWKEGALGEAITKDWESKMAANEGIAYGDGNSLTGTLKPGKYGSSRLTSEQLRNAKIIANVGAGLGFNNRGLQVALMAALQESGLRNLNYGDRDSLGLFQQRAPWGSAAARTDPEQAAKMFFTGGHGGQRGLEDIKGWQKMGLAQAAQAVEVSAFPGAYAKWADEAKAILAKLSRVTDSAAGNADIIGPQGSGMSGAKKAGQMMGADYIAKHRDPQGLPSYDMGVPFRSAKGDNISAHLRKYRQNYGLDYVIWDKQISSPRENWKWRDYNRVAAGDWKHQHHVHSTYFSGTPSATPGWALVGEQGPEFIKLKGGEKVLNHTQSKSAVMAGKSQQVVRPGTINNSYAYDHSVRVDKVEVVSNDPKSFIRVVEAEARLAALTAPRKSGGS